MQPLRLPLLEGSVELSALGGYSTMAPPSVGQQSEVCLFPQPVADMIATAARSFSGNEAAIEAIQSAVDETSLAGRFAFDGGEGVYAWRGLNGARNFIALPITVDVASAGDPPMPSYMVLTATELLTLKLERGCKFLCCGGRISAAVESVVKLWEVEQCNVFSQTLSVALGAWGPAGAASCKTSASDNASSCFLSVKLASPAVAVAAQWAVLRQRDLLSACWPAHYVSPRRIPYPVYQSLQAEVRSRTYVLRGSIAFQSMRALALFSGQGDVAATLDECRGELLTAMRTCCTNASIARSSIANGGGAAAVLPYLELTEATISEYGLFDVLCHDTTDGLLLRGPCPKRLASFGCGIGHPSLRRLFLVQHNISDWQPFLQLMRRPGACLTVLRLEGSPVPSAILEQLFTPTTLPIGLSELSLADASIDAVAAHCIAGFLVASPTVLRSLILDGNRRLGIDGVTRIAQAVMQRGLPLRLLSLANCGTVVGGELCRAAALLHEICLMDSAMTGDVPLDAVALLSNCPGHVAVSGSTITTPPQWAAVLALCPPPPPLGLTPVWTIRIGANGDLALLCSGADAVPCAPISRRRVRLVLSPGVPPLSERDAVRLSRVATVVELRMSPPAASRRALEHGGARLLACLPDVEVFECRFPSAEGTAPSSTVNAALVTDAIARHTKVKELVLHGFGGGDSLVVPIGSALKLNRSITHLDVDNNGSGEAGWLAIRKCLYGNRKLVQIVIQQDMARARNAISLQSIRSKIEHHRTEMKRHFRYRNRTMGRQECNEMVRWKALLRVETKRLARYDSIQQQITAAVKANVEHMAPKFAREAVRVHQQAEKRARREAAEGEKWTTRHSSLWAGNDGQPVAPQRQRPGQPHAQPKPPKAAIIAARAPKIHGLAWGAVRELAMGQWVETAATHQSATILRSLSRRISSFFEDCVGRGVFAAEWVPIAAMLPALESHYVSCHVAYCDALRTVSRLPFPAGWIAVADVSGNRCFINPSSGLATYLDPRLLRESAGYFPDADVGQELYATWFMQQQGVREMVEDPIALYVYNLYLAIYFESYAFPLPRDRRPVVFNIPVLPTDVAAQYGMPTCPSPVVDTIPPRLIRSPMGAGVVMSQRLFYAANGLISDMYDSIASSEYATTEDRDCPAYWKPWSWSNPSPDATYCAPLGMNGVLEPVCGIPELEVLWGLQTLYRQVQFQQLPPAFMEVQEGLQMQRRSNDQQGGAGAATGGGVDADVFIAAASVFMLQSYAGSPSTMQYFSTVLPIDAYGGVAASRGAMLLAAAPAADVGEGRRGDPERSRHPASIPFPTPAAPPLPSHAVVAVEEFNSPPRSVASESSSPSNASSVAGEEDTPFTPVQTPAEHLPTDVHEGTSEEGTLEPDLKKTSGCTVSRDVDMFQSPEFLKALAEEYRRASNVLFPRVQIRRHAVVRAGGSLQPSPSKIQGASSEWFAVVTQCSVDRCDRLQRMGESLRRYLPYLSASTSSAPPQEPSFMNVALVASVFVRPRDGSISDIRAALQRLAKRLVRQRHCAVVHFAVVHADDVSDAPALGSQATNLYPINALRNLATTAARDTIGASVGLLLDVDFAVRGDLFHESRSPFVSLDEGRRIFEDLHENREPLAVVLPAFEWNGVEGSAEPPAKSLSTVTRVAHHIASGEMEVFHERHYAVGHGPTMAREQWLHQPCRRGGEHFYDIAYEDGYEPYVLVPLRRIPLYDARFVGYGFNKVQHLKSLHALGFRFVACPRAFVVSLPHEKSASWKATFDVKNDAFHDSRKIWLQALYDRFNQELSRSPCTVSVK